MYEYKDIRNFYFEDEKGQQIDCQKLNGGLFLYNVSGLGYEKEIEYEQLGNTFIPNKEKLKQNQINGELEFYDMTYDEYQSFINFINNSSHLKLIYIPKTSNRTKYYRDIDFCKIDKAEEDDFNILTCPITINCKSLWYEERTLVYNLDPSEENVLRWDFKWDSKFADYDVSNLVIKNEGHIPAPVLIEINGRVVNPKIELWVEGIKYQTVNMNTTIEEFEKLLYGTKENDFYIRKQKADGTIENLFKLDVIDFANDNVIRIPKKKSCELKIIADTEIQKIKVTMFVYYIAV